MSIQDVLKKSFLNQFNSDLSTTSIVGTLILTALIGTYIFVIYRAVCRKAFYSKSFAISLPVISMITASIIISHLHSVQRCNLSWHGGCAVHRPFPNCGKRPHGFGVFVLDDFCGHHLRCRSV